MNNNYNINKQNINDELNEERVLEDDEIEIERNGTEFVDDKEKIYLDKTEWSFNEIIDRIKDGTLNVRPNYQRNFVWTKTAQSKLIESILLEIPIPNIFIAQNKDGTFEVVDGQQRILTILSFMLEGPDDIPESLRDDIKQLKLTKLEILHDYNGKTFNDIAEKHTFGYNKFIINIVGKDSGKDIKYELFVRINSGAKRLNDQEVINVMFRGDYIDFLNNFISQNEFINKINFTSNFKESQNINKLLLRAIVMNNFVNENFDLQEYGQKSYNGRYRQVMLDYLENNKNCQEEITRIDKFLKTAIENVYMLFGDKSFIRDLDSTNKKYNLAIAEMQLICLSRFTKEKLLNNKEKIISSFKMFAEENKDIFTRATTNTDSFIKRINWGKTIEDILSNE